MKLPLISILLIAAAIVAWQLINLPSDSATTASNDPQSPAALVKKTLNHPQSAAPSDRPANHNQPDLDNPQATEMELVQGIYVRKDRNCSVEVDERFDPDTGNLRRLYACTPNSLPEPDPYTAYDSQVLAGMAYGDARAAEVLGVRLLTSENPTTQSAGLNYLLRSAALANHTRPIALAVNNRYNDFASNGTLHLDNIKRLVTLSHISNVITPNSMSGAVYQNILRESGVSEEEIARLITAGNQALERMADIQTQVTGNTQLREALDDA